MGLTRKSLEINPKDATAYHNRGLVKHALGDMEGAMPDYDKAIEINPDYAYAYNSRGVAKRKSRRL